MKFARIAFLLLALVVSVFVLAACGGAGSTTGSTQPGVVDMKNNKYIPDTVTIKAGETVTWKNSEAIIHDVRFQDATRSPAEMKQGDQWNRTFAQAGTYDYICTYHEAIGMKGKVIVQ
ncbi:MAG: cupredoxin domain-containing protein [Chloroflexi bacterium]|nr:cupredoxin domain-containing protein [Chloroflexota bacterium]